MPGMNLKNWPIFNMLDPIFMSEVHMAVVYGQLGNKALIVTKSGMVYGLGIDNITSLFHPYKIDVLCGKDIKTFAFGKGPHVLALTNKGEVYSWGCNNHYQLGNTDEIIGLTPKLVSFNFRDKVIVQIACGYRHSLALTNDGEVFAWGANDFYQVSDTSNGRQTVPLKVRFPSDEERVSFINCGRFSSMAITDEGSVYGWGSNCDGELGIITRLPTPTKPIKIDSLVGIPIEKVVCGDSHVVALSNKGDLYVWGKNNFGQLGLGHRKPTSGPMKLVLPYEIVDIAASQYDNISVAVDKTRAIHVWGLCLEEIVTVPMVTGLECFRDVFAVYGNSGITYEPLTFVNEEDTCLLVDAIKNVFDDASTSDLVVKVEGKCIYVHKAVLRIRSKYLRSMLKSVSAEGNQSVINVEWCSYEIYKAFLKYLYTGEIDTSLENIIELLKLAIAHSEDELKKRCLQMIKKFISEDTVMCLYGAAVENDIKELEECCFKFALNRMYAIVQTPGFAKLNNDTLVTFIIKAAKAGVFKT